VRSSVAGVGAGGTVFAAGFFFPMLADGQWTEDRTDDAVNTRQMTEAVDRNEG
jgi:hypothetical protein